MFEKFKAALAKALAQVAELKAALAEERQALKAARARLKGAEAERDSMRAWGAMKAGRQGWTEVTPAPNQTLFDKLVQLQKAARGGGDQFGARQKHFQDQNKYTPGEVKWMDNE